MLPCTHMHVAEVKNACDEAITHRMCSLHGSAVQGQRVLQGAHCAACHALMGWQKHCQKLVTARLHLLQ